MASVNVPDTKGVGEVGSKNLGVGLGQDQGVGRLDCDSGGDIGPQESGFRKPSPADLWLNHLTQL